MIKHRSEDDANRVSSRITARISERADLLEMNAAESGLFAEFAGGGIVERLVLVNEAARKSPQTLERFACALDQQHLDAISGTVKQCNVDGQSRSWMIVTVGLRTIGFGTCHAFRLV